MGNTIFIKESFIKALDSSTNNVEEINSVFENNIINRTEYLKETCQALNSDDQKLILISGFQGTGKTEFINTLIYALEENILDFYYECSSITHLDDIILSLFNYLKKVSIKTPEYKRTFKISNNQSIDERLMNYIKSLNTPLLIVIDGFENLINDNLTELTHFFDFLSSLSEIKIIVSGRKINLSDFINSDNTFEIRLGGLEEQETFKILRSNGIEETESCMQQIFQVTRGYPENLLWFSNAVNALKIPSFELMQEYHSKEQKSFEEFIYQKILKSIPDEYQKTICFFATIRHSLNLETLEKLNFTPDILEKTNFLTSRMILTQNRGDFYIKNMLKNLIYSNISPEEKKQIHRYLYEIYSEQISKKLEERIFRISRKLLYSEQYHHYMCLINYGDTSLPDIKTSTLSGLKPDFKYLYANISDTLFTGNKEEPVEENKFQENEPFKETLSVQSNPVSSMESIIEPGAEIFSDFKIELSEEEKALLNENESDDFIGEQKENQDNEHPSEELCANVCLSSGYTPTSQLQEKAEFLKAGAHACYKERKYDEAVKKFEEALILYEILKDKAVVNNILLSIAKIYNESFRHDVALMYYYKILSLENDTLKPDLIVESLCGIADIYDYRKDFENAFKFYGKALQEAEKYNNSRQKANIFFKLALAYDDIENYDRALEFYFKTTEVSQDIETNPDIAAAYSNIAAIYEEREDLNKAKEYYSDSLRFDKLLNNKEGQYDTLSDIGNIYFELMDLEKANECFHKALSIARQISDTYKIAMSCLDIGDIYLQEKLYKKALKAFITAGKTIEKTISTDSREKIDRRFKAVITEIGDYKFKQIIENLKKKHG